MALIKETAHLEIAAEIMANTTTRGKTRIKLPASSKRTAKTIWRLLHQTGPERDHSEQTMSWAERGEEISRAQEQT